MKRRNFFAGLIILLILGLAIFFWQKNKKDLTVPEETPARDEEKIEERFNIVLPDDVEKITLKDSSKKDLLAIATRKHEDGQFQMTILADLPSLEDGKYYQAWIVRGEEGGKDYSIISLGSLSVAKGGYLIDFKSQGNYMDYDGVVISKELILDSNMEEIVLRGSF